jgi:hypothetical protein
MFAPWPASSGLATSKKPKRNRFPGV